MVRAGVLALQGSFAPHAERLGELDAAPLLVRRAADLADLTHLVLPGGESTTLLHLLRLTGIEPVLLRRFREGTLALFGTCAGAILLGRAAGEDATPPRWGLLDAELERNAYGTQVDSFACELESDELGGAPFHGVFIRAPRVTRVGDGARVLARCDSAVWLSGPGVMAATFHPELTRDTRIHARFLALEPAPCGSAR